MSRFKLIVLVISLTLLAGCKEDQMNKDMLTKLPYPVIEITNPTITSNKATWTIKISITGTNGFLNDHSKYRMGYQYYLTSDVNSLNNIDWFGGVGSVACKLELGTLSSGEETWSFSGNDRKTKIIPKSDKYLVSLITIQDEEGNEVFKTWGTAEINWN